MAYDNGNYVSKAPAVGPNSPLTGGQKIGGWEGNIKYVVNDSLSIGVPAGQVIPTPSHFRPYLAHFPPVFPHFLRVFTALTRRFQRAASRNPGPRDIGKGAQTPFLRPS